MDYFTPRPHRRKTKRQHPKKPTGKALIERAEMAMKEFLPGDEKAF